MTRVVYLHGFASSPQSSKAQFFRRRFTELGVPFEIPQLDQGNFEGLTLSNQLEVIGRAVDGRPAILMGSSLGGYLAALYAARHPEIERAILLAPAFHFLRRWRERFSEAELAEWKRTGTLLVFHYGFGEERRLGYQIVEDSQGYEDEPAFAQAGLILHGRRDPVVPASLSEAFATRRPNVRLRLFDSGHELTDVLDPMWEEIRAFLRGC